MVANAFCTTQRYSFSAVSVRRRYWCTLSDFPELLNRARWWYGGLGEAELPRWRVDDGRTQEARSTAMYDVPLTWREALIINLTGWSFGIIWWFFLGAAASVVWQKLKRSS